MNAESIPKTTLDPNDRSRDGCDDGWEGKHNFFSNDWGQTEEESQEKDHTPEEEEHEGPHMSESY